MRFEPTLTSSLETECLFGETLTILDNYSDWYYCRLLTDSYCGWVQKKYLGERLLTTHRVVSTRTFLFKDNNVKSGCINYLPLGSQIYVKDIDKFWAKICLSNDLNYKFGFIPSNHIKFIKLDIIISLLNRFLYRFLTAILILFNTL